MEKIKSILSNFTQGFLGPRRGRYIVLVGVLITILSCVSIILILALSSSSDNATTGEAVVGIFSFISLFAGIVIVIVGGIMSILINRKNKISTKEMDLSVSASPEITTVNAESSVTEQPFLESSPSKSEYNPEQSFPVQPSMSQPFSDMPLPTPSLKKDKSMTNPSTSPQQPVQPDNLIKKFLSEEQDPAQVQQVFAKVRQILTNGEEILYIAVQKQMISLSPDSVVLTNKRFIIFRPTLLGKASFQDYIWRDLHDARLSEGIVKSTITLQTIKGQLLKLGDLPKAQARKLYAFAQEMEEKVLEERRARDMEEKRAGAGGIILQGGLPIAQTPAPVHQEDDPMQKLKKLKDMLDAGLINEQEYNAKKTDILSKF